MINEFSGIGNVGNTPVLSKVNVGGEKRKSVANLRIYFDRPVGNDFKDKGGFWLTVDIWGYRAEEAMRILQKGARVFVKGTLRKDNWTDDKGEVRSELRLSADYFFIDSVCIETVFFHEKKQKNYVEQAEAAVSE